jgi:hypothetical protein
MLTELSPSEVVAQVPEEMVELPSAPAQERDFQVASSGAGRPVLVSLALYGVTLLAFLEQSRTLLLGQHAETVFLRLNTMLFLITDLARTVLVAAQAPHAEEEVDLDLSELTLMSMEPLPSEAEAQDLAQEDPLVAALALHVEMDLDLAQSALTLILIMTLTLLLEVAQEAAAPNIIAQKA